MPADPAPDSGTDRAGPRPTRGATMLVASVLATVAVVAALVLTPADRDVELRGYLGPYERVADDLGRPRALFELASDVVAEAHPAVPGLEREIGVSWSEVVAHYRDQVERATADARVLFLVDEMLSVLGDPHTYVFDEEAGLAGETLPIGVELVEGRVVLSELSPLLARAPAILNELELGDVLTAIDGIDTQEVIADIARRLPPRLSDDARARMIERRLFRSYRAYVGGDVSWAELTFRTSPGDVSTVRLTWNETSAFRDSRGVRGRRAGGPVTGSRTGRVGTIRIPGFDGPEFVTEFEKALDEVAAADLLLLDLRGNMGGDFTTYAARVLAQFVPSDAVLATKRFRRSKLFEMLMKDRPGYDQAVRGRDPTSEPWLPPVDVTVSGGVESPDARPVFLLLNGEHFSAADMFIAAFVDLGVGEVVGRVKPLHSGQPLHVPFGRFRLSCSTAATFGPSGVRTEGRVVPVDHRIPFHKDELTSDRDVLLERAVQYVRDRGS